MIVLIQTDFPEPVVPAINKCGIEVKSPIIDNPEILLPKAIGNFISLLLNLSLEIISLKKTPSLFHLVFQYLQCFYLELLLPLPK